MATAGSSSATLHPSLDGVAQDMVQRRPSTVQPHFAEKITTVRRLSQVPGEPDKIQRVNSISSTLHQEADVESDTLPYGGRKSSVGSVLSHASIRGTEEGEVAMGERRPSVLMDPMAGVLDVKRVSVGGVEDIIRVRSASQGDLQISSTLERVDSSDPEEILPSPPLSSSHPFSTSNQAKEAKIASAVPFRLEEPPKSLLKKTFRPDSITLVKQKQSPIDFTQLTAQGEPLTCISTIPLKSPYESFSPDSDQGTAKIFEAWRGFPSKDGQSDTPTGDDPHGEDQPILSPRTPALNTSAGPPMGSPSPLPIFTLTPIEAPTIVVSSSEPPQTTTKPTRLEIPPNTLSPGSSPKASPNKITYLADVVRENEERRKSQQADGSSTVAMASLEDRPRTIY